MVPTVRLTLRTGSSSATAVPSCSAPSASWISVLSRARSIPWSCATVWRRGAAAAEAGAGRAGARAEPGLLPVAGGAGGVEPVDTADRLIQGGEPERGQVLTDFLRDELEEVDHELM